jgi:hypothetical protein
VPENPWVDERVLLQFCREYDFDTKKVIEAYNNQLVFR